MVELDRLRVFQAVAETHSFTRAADRLHLTQPGISKHIKQMEEYFGVPLFDRLGRKIALTQAGEILLETTQEVMALVVAAEHRIEDLSGMRAGKLTLGSSFPVGVYTLPRVLAAFREKHPQIDVTLEIAVSATIEAAVLANRLELGLVSSEVHDSRLVADRFMTDELVVIVPKDHRWTRRGRIGARDLLTETFIVAAQGAGARRVVESRLAAKGIVLENVIDFVNVEGVKHAVEAGLGVSIQPRKVVKREVEAGVISAHRLADLDSQISYFSIYRKGRHVSKAGQAFLELLERKA